MKKTYKVKGMSCNSCAMIITRSLKDKVNSISVSYANEYAEIDFDEKKISEDEIRSIVKKLGYDLVDKEDKSIKEKLQIDSNTIGWIVLFISLLIVLFIIYYLLSPYLPEISLPKSGENMGLALIFLIGLLTGFHCVSMCGAFVVSYTAKNAINGHKSFYQHLFYGGSKLISYTVIGGIFGLIGGIFAFSLGLRAGVAIFAGIFMIFYSLSMFGLKFFRKFQFNSKYLSKLTISATANAKGPYKAPIITGLLNGLFIACGPLQAMYLYAAGTGSFTNGATALAAFGLGTLPVMLGFGSLATVISHKTTQKILKISAVIVLILGIIMLDRGLSMIGSPYSFSAIQSKISGNQIPTSSGGVVTNGVQEINMDVTGAGYSPNSFVLKKGIPVKWNVNVKELTSCDQELVLNEYGIDKNLIKGINVMEFTPDKDGPISFSCGMGMLHGSFVVTDTGTATEEQLKVVAPKSSTGGSCSMGANGGGCGCGMKM